MNDAFEVSRAIGRYPAPMIDKVFFSVGAIFFVTVGLSRLSSDTALAVLYSVAGGALAGRAWLLPATVVTARGIRRGRLLRFTPWSQVIAVYPPPGNGYVQVHLRNKKLILLGGVRNDRLPGIVSLAPRRLTQ